MEDTILRHSHRRALASSQHSIRDTQSRHSIETLYQMYPIKGTLSPSVERALYHKRVMYHNLSAIIEEDGACFSKASLSGHAFPVKYHATDLYRRPLPLQASVYQRRSLSKKKSDAKLPSCSMGLTFLMVIEDYCLPGVGRRKLDGYIRLVRNIVVCSYLFYSVLEKEATRSSLEKGNS